MYKENRTKSRIPLKMPLQFDPSVDKRGLLRLQHCLLGFPPNEKYYNRVAYKIGYFPPTKKQFSYFGGSYLSQSRQTIWTSRFDKKPAPIHPHNVDDSGSGLCLYCLSTFIRYVFFFFFKMIDLFFSTVCMFLCAPPKKKKLIFQHFYAELIHGSIIRPKVTRDTHAPFKNEVIQNLNLYLIPELDDIRVPDDFSIDTSPDSYQPPADILKLILFNHNRLVKNIALLEKDPSPKETLRLFNKNSTLQNVSLLLSIINK